MNSGRGMKKWMPFAALPEHQIYMNRMMKDMEKVHKPELSESQKEEINTVLSMLKPGDVIKISYYDDGFVRKEKAEFIKLDLYCKAIILKNKKILFSNLLSLEL